MVSAGKFQAVFKRELRRICFTEEREKTLKKQKVSWCNALSRFYPRHTIQRRECSRRGGLDGASRIY